MRAPVLLTSLLSSGLAAQQLGPRQAATTPKPDPFPGNARQLLSLYIPSSVTSLLYSVYTSVESTTGDPASVIEAAFTAATPPAWLDAVPSAYQSNIEALEAAIASLRAAATGGLGASVPEWSAIASSVLLTGSSSAQETSSLSVTGSDSRDSIASSTGSLSSTTETVKKGGLTPVTATPSFNWGSSSSEGGGAPTGVPVVVAGVVGFVGAVLAL